VKADGGYEVGKRLRALMVFGEHDLGERAPSRGSIFSSAGTC